MLVSGERVNLPKDRSKVFLQVGLELVDRGVVDIAAFNI